MNTRTVLAASLLLNVVAVGAVGYFMLKSPVTIAPVHPIILARAAASGTKALRSEPTEVTAFHWRTVEAEDYKKYITNLRSIGCPEETIRDIIVADVTKLYSQKLAAAARTKEFKYWQNSSSRPKLAVDNRRVARDLDRERWTLLRDLLGPGVEGEYRKGVLSADAATEETVLAFLSEAKRASVREIAERYTEQESELRRRGAFTQKERAEMKALRERRNAELAAVLTPGELMGYELRTSTTADNLRNRLAGVELDPNQFEQVFLFQKAFDDEFNRDLVQFDAATIERRGVAQRQLDENIKVALGDRYTEFSRAQDPAWRGLVEVGRDQNIPAVTLNKVFEMKKLVEENLRTALSDPNLPRENRVATLKSIGDQTEQALVQLLGEKGWEAYKQNGGFWVPGQAGGTVMYRTVTDSGDNVQMRAVKFDGGSSIITLPPGAVGGATERRSVIVLPGSAPARP